MRCNGKDWGLPSHKKNKRVRLLRGLVQQSRPKMGSRAEREAEEVRKGTPQKLLCLRNLKYTKQSCSKYAATQLEYLSTYGNGNVGTAA